MNQHQQLASLWLQEAEGLERSAKAYTRCCIRDKAMQNILLAKQLRHCAAQVHAIEAANAQAASVDAIQPIAGTMAEVSTGSQAHNGQGPASEEQQDQAT